MASLWSRALNKRVLVSLALVAAVLVPSVVEAPAANAATCPTPPGGPLRSVYNGWGDDSVVINLHCDGSGALYATGTIYTGDLAANHCFEVFHNVDLNEHKAPEMIRLCSPWTAKSFNYPIYRQDGNRAYANQIANLWLNRSSP